MIEVAEWSREVVYPAPVGVTFTVSSPAPIVSVSVDLLGDGWPGVTVRGDDLRPVGALRLVPPRRGQFNVQVRAQDARGCEDATGARRVVEVR